MFNLTPIENNHPIYDALEQIQKGRSRFQLEHFVAGQHDTEPQRYRQVLLELQQLLYHYKVIQLEMKKREIEIERLLSTNDEIDAIDAEIKKLAVSQDSLAVLGAERELRDLIEMWESFEHKYTYEELEADQMIYWDARLTRQAQLEAVGGSGKVNWASLDALRQIGKFNQQVIDETNPNNVIITYKNGGATVATKTIVITGAITTITVTAP